LLNYFGGIQVGGVCDYSRYADEEVWEVGEEGGGEGGGVGETVDVDMG